MTVHPSPGLQVSRGASTLKPHAKLENSGARFSGGGAAGSYQKLRPLIGDILLSGHSLLIFTRLPPPLLRSQQSSHDIQGT